MSNTNKSFFILALVAMEFFKPNANAKKYQTYPLNIATIKADSLLLSLEIFNLFLMVFHLLIFEPHIPHFELDYSNVRNGPDYRILSQPATLWIESTSGTYTYDDGLIRHTFLHSNEPNLDFLSSSYCRSISMKRRHSNSSRSSSMSLHPSTIHVLIPMGGYTMTMLKLCKTN